MKPWYESLLTSGSISFLGTASFARVGDATWEHTFWLALGMTCATITLHRLVLLGHKYG